MRSISQPWDGVDQALAEINRARELEPVSIPINMALGRHFLLARQYDQAIEQELRTLELDPNFPMARFRLGQAYVEKAMFREAITEFQEALKLSDSNPRIIGALGHAYAQSGRRGEAEKTDQEIAGDVAATTMSRPRTLPLSISASGTTIRRLTGWRRPLRSAPACWSCSEYSLRSIACAQMHVMRNLFAASVSRLESARFMEKGGQL